MASLLHAPPAKREPSAPPKWERCLSVRRKYIAGEAATKCAVREVNKGEGRNSHAELRRMSSPSSVNCAAGVQRPKVPAGDFSGACSARPSQRTGCGVLSGVYRVDAAKVRLGVAAVYAGCRVVQKRHRTRPPVWQLILFMIGRALHSRLRRNREVVPLPETAG